jgi:hypothetical protein
MPTGTYDPRRPRADGQPPVSSQRADVGRPEESAFHHSYLGRSGVGTVAWGQSPMLDQLHLCMRISAGVWRGGCHLLSAAEGDAHWGNRPSVFVYGRHLEIFKSLRHLNGDDHTGTSGLASRARRGERAGALSGPTPRPAVGYSRETPSGSDRLLLSEVLAGGSSIWGTGLPPQKGDPTSAVGPSHGPRLGGGYRQGRPVESWKETSGLLHRRSPFCEQWPARS